MQSQPSPNLVPSIEGGAVTGAAMTLMDGQEEIGNLKNMIPPEQNGRADGSVNWNDRQGPNAESRGSRRSVVFSKIKNNGPTPSGGGGSIHGQPTTNKHQMKVIGNEK